MKKLLWPLVLLSLGLNLVLAWQITHRPAASPALAPAAAKNFEVTKPAGESGTLWASLQPEDQPAMVARLRSAGFPPEVVRAILQAQVGQEFQARRKALDPEAETRPFWKRNQPDPKLITAQRQLAREQQARLKALLGADAEGHDPMNEFYRARQFGDLPPDKIAQVEAIQREMNERQSDLFSSTGGVGAMTAEKFRELERQQRDALTKVLTPGELEQYDFRNSSAGNSVRTRVAGMDLTEQEFRTLYQLQDAIDQRYSMQGPTPPSEEIMRQRREAEQQMNEQIKGLLGPTRYPEYERAGQPDYRSTSQLVARLELPPQTTQQIWAVREDFMQRATAIRATRGLPPDQRTQQLAALQQEAAQVITPLVGGARGFEAYQQYGGSWLQRINPPPPPPRPGAPSGPTGTLTPR